MSFIDPVKESQVVASLRASIAALDGDDELLVDVIEGQTSLFEAFDMILVRITTDKALADGVDMAIAALETRKARFMARVEHDRALIEQAMSTADLKTVERPAGTLTLSERAPSLVVNDESEIPAMWWKAGKPALDKKGLTAALRARAAEIEEAQALDGDEKAAALAAISAPIPGVSLSNAAPSLMIRVK